MTATNKEWTLEQVRDLLSKSRRETASDPGIQGNQDIGWFQGRKQVAAALLLEGASCSIKVGGNDDFAAAKFNCDFPGSEIFQLLRLGNDESFQFYDCDGSCGYYSRLR